MCCQDGETGQVRSGRVVGATRRSTSGNDCGRWRRGRQKERALRSLAAIEDECTTQAAGVVVRLHRLHTPLTKEGGRSGRCSQKPRGLAKLTWPARRSKGRPSDPTSTRQRKHHAKRTTTTKPSNLASAPKRNVLHCVVGTHGGVVVCAEAVAHETADDRSLAALGVADDQHLAGYRRHGSRRHCLQGRRRRDPPAAAIGATNRRRRRGSGGGGGVGVGGGGCGSRHTAQARVSAAAR